MSGEKCSEIEVSDRTTLFDAWQKGARERQERAALEQEERVARERDEREDERRLAEFEAAQRAREQEALEGARGQLAELTSEFESLRARASEMQRNMDGIELPPGPALPEVNQNDTAAILAGLSGIETTIAGYRSRLNDSMLRYSRDRAAAEGRDEVLDWYGSFVATTPGATIGFANNEALAGREAQADELRRQAFERARDLMGTIEGRVVHVSEDLRQALEAVLNAPSHAGMRTAEAGLRLMVGRECERVDREQARRRSELERLQTDRVAAVMAESLAQMGYVVSNIYESAYTANGHIIACRRDRAAPEHAVRLTIDRETQQVTSNVVRVVDSDVAPVRTDEQEKQDREADATWCNHDDSHGIVRFESELEARGVKVTFKPNGARQVDTVSAAAVAAASPTLAEHLRAGGPRAAARQQPKARSRQTR